MTPDTAVARIEAGLAEAQPDTHSGTTYGRSKQFGKLAAALASVQAELENPTEDRTAKVETSKGPGLSYGYVDLATVLDTVRGPLARHGICLLQPVSSDGSYVTVTTLLLHESEQWISSELTLLAAQQTPQAVGSATTYGRRYGLCALLGISAEKDDDGNEGTGNKATLASKRKPYQGTDDDLPPKKGTPPPAETPEQAKSVQHQRFWRLLGVERGPDQEHGPESHARMLGELMSHCIKQPDALAAFALLRKQLIACLGEENGALSYDQALADFEGKDGKPVRDPKNFKFVRDAQGAAAKMFNVLWAEKESGRAVVTEAK